MLRSSTAPEDGVPVALSLSRWPAYAGLLLAVGLVWFATMLLPSGLDKLDRAWRRLVRAARLAAGVVGHGLAGGGTADGALPARHRAAHACWTPPRGARCRPRRSSSRPPRWSASWPPPGCCRETRAWSSRHQLAALAGLLALAPLPLSGHTRAETETVARRQRRLAAPGRRQRVAGRAGRPGADPSRPGRPARGRRHAGQPVLHRGGRGPRRARALRRVPGLAHRGLVGRAAHRRLRTAAPGEDRRRRAGGRDRDVQPLPAAPPHERGRRVPRPGRRRSGAVAHHEPSRPWLWWGCCW